MDTLIRILHLEDDAADEELVQATLEAAGMAYQIDRVQTREGFSDALRTGGYDVILADYRLPMYDGMSALRLVKELQVDVPFIFVSGTMGEDAAIEALTHGATDYVLKQKLSRLPPALKRALLEAENQRERSRMERSLAENEARLRTLVQTIPDLIWLKDMNGVYLACNTIFERFFGAKERDILGKTDYDFVDRELADFFREHDRKCMAAGKPSSNEEWLTFADDGYRGLFDTIKTPMYDAEGKLIGVLGISHDITQIKKAEEEMAKLALAIEQAVECVVITSPEGLIQYVNPAFERITGYAKEDALGRNPSILKSGVQDEAFYKDLWETITGGNTWVGRLVNRRKNGTLYHEDASISPVRDKTGNIVNFVAVKKDITKEVNLEERVLRSQKLEAIGTLAGGIAHDFNNILTSIIGFTELAEHEISKDNPAHAMLGEVLKAGKRATDLVKQILTFSRQIVSKKVPVKVHLIAKETVKLLRASIPKNIDIVDKISSKTGPVDADPTKIHQIIMNLCTNAYHAMIPDGGSMTISLNTAQVDSQLRQRAPSLKEGPYLRLMVSDTGCGMDNETMKRVFDPFFTTKEKGTGLGLSTVYGIIAELDGLVTVSSETGKGSTFTVYLPITESVLEKEREDEAEEEEYIESKKGHILLVDDEESIIHFTRIMLEQLGYTVTSLSSSMEALILFRSVPQRYDMVITDYMMPEINGTQLAEEILNLRPDIPIILMTGYDEDISQAKAMGLGIREYIEKPFTEKMISHAIQRLLEKDDKV